MPEISSFSQRGSGPSDQEKNIGIAANPGQIGEAWGIFVPINGSTMTDQIAVLNRGHDMHRQIGEVFVDRRQGNLENPSGHHCQMVVANAFDAL